MKKIAIDADDVLLDTITIVNQFHNEKYNTSFIHDDYVTFHFSDFLGISQEQIRENERLLYKSPLHSKMKTKEDAYQAIDYLSKEFGLSVITGRSPEFEEYLIATLARLFKQNHFERIYHVGNSQYNQLSQQKWELCEELSIPLLIDDFHGHLINASKEGIHGILMEMPWNKNITDFPPLVTRVRNWNEAVDVIEKKKWIWD